MIYASRTLVAGLAAAVSLLFTASAVASSGGGIPFLRGVDYFPNESCTQCHYGGMSNGPSAMVEILVDGLPVSDYSYEPGETVSLVMNFSDDTANVVGFLVMARSGSPVAKGSENRCGTGGTMQPGDTEAGALVKVRNGDSLGTKPEPCGALLSDVWWATHVRPVVGSSAAWEVAWTMPSENVGPITLLFVGNGASGGRDQVRDNIFSRRLTIEPATPREPPSISGAGDILQTNEGATPRWAPGAIASVAGSNFVSGSEVPGGSLDDAGRLPERVHGVCVEVGPRRARLLSVSSDKVTFQVPSDAGLGASIVRLVRDCDTPDAVASEAIAIQVTAVQPRLLQFPDGSGIAAVRRSLDLAAATGSLPGLRTHAAVPGETLTFFGTGFGLATPPYGDGELVSDLRPLEAASLRVMIGEMEVDSGYVRFAGAAPHFTGLQQVVVEIPETVPSGAHALGVLLDGVESSAGPILDVESADALLPAVTCAAGLVLNPGDRCRLSYGATQGIVETSSAGEACALTSIIDAAEGWECGTERLDLGLSGWSLRKNEDGTWTIVDSDNTATSGQQP